MKRLLLYLFFLVIFCVLIALGVWQTKRAAYKIELQEIVATRMNEPITLQDLLNSEKSLAEMRYQYISAQNLKLVRSYRLANKVRNQKMGYELISLFEHSKNEPLLIVNQGWLEQQKPFNGIKNNQVSLEGYLKFPKNSPFFILENDYFTNELYSVKPQELSKQLNRDVLPFVLYMTNASEKSDIKHHPKEVTVANPHINYAATWYSLALGLVIFVIFLRRSDRKKDKK